MQDENLKNGNFLVKNEWKKRFSEGSGYLIATPQTIEAVEQAVQTDPVCGKDANGFELEHFFGLHPTNTYRDAVIHKILLIDYTNSTNLRLYRKKGTTVFSLADQIVNHSQVLDRMIQDGNPEAVCLLAGFGTVNLFSFATKYCCYHNTICYKEDDYSIYDNLVADAIPYYLNVKRYYISKCREKRDYLEYKRIIDTLIAVYDLKDIPHIRRKMDHFLWYSNRSETDRESFI